MPDASPSSSGSANRQTAKNIESILKLEQEEEDALSPLHQLSHGVGAFVGTIYFVGLQFLFAVAWIAINTTSFNSSYKLSAMSSNNGAPATIKLSMPVSAVI